GIRLLESAERLRNILDEGSDFFRAEAVEKPGGEALRPDAFRCHRRSLLSIDWGQSRLEREFFRSQLITAVGSAMSESRVSLDDGSVSPLTCPSGLEPPRALLGGGSSRTTTRLDERGAGRVISPGGERGAWTGRGSGVSARTLSGRAG